MPHFIIDTNEDGSIRQIYKDGEPHEGGVNLEQHYSIVTTYFKFASRNLRMLAKQESSEDKRFYGLQSFLMSMTGLEAFTNTFFHQRSEELGRPEMLKRIEQSHGSITRKIVDLVEMSGDGPLRDQKMLVDRLYEFVLLRNEIVHPRWVPSKISMPGDVWLHINGMVENRQALFEDASVCREALDWCLLFLARVAQSIGHTDVSGFLFYWSGNYGLSLNQILDALGLQEEV